jgi:hypothetical protein
LGDGWLGGVAGAGWLGLVALVSAGWLAEEVVVDVSVEAPVAAAVLAASPD